MPWIAVTVFVAAYVLIATEWVHRVGVALGGAAIMLLIGATERAGQRISFWEFTKYALTVTLITVAICGPYLYLRFF